MIPVLYPANERNFENRGLGPLYETTECFITEELNGEYELEMTYPVSGRHYNDISDRCIIMAMPSPYRDPQPFRIYEIEAPINGLVTIRARHVSYDLSGVVVSPFAYTGNGKAVLDKMVDYSVPTPQFSFSSNITTSHKLTVEVPTSFRGVLGGMEESMLEIFGGEVLFDRWRVRVLSSRGVNRNVRIAYGKNITDFKMIKNLDAVITSIYPYWTDGETVVEVDNGQYGKTVPVVQGLNYSNILPIDFSGEIKDKPTAEQLLTAANTYVSKTDLAVPKVTFDVSFVDLASTEEQDLVTALELVDLGDTVIVIFPLYGIETTAKIVSIKHNVLLERYETVTIGTVRANIADTIAGLKSGTNMQLVGSGGGGTGNYNELINKPSINSIVLTGNKTASDLGLQPKLTAGNMVGINNNVVTATIPCGTVDSTSTSTAFTATVPHVYSLVDGVACYISNDGRNASAKGWTLNVNGLGAKPVYSSMAEASRIETTFAKGYTWLFIYNSDRVSGGCWDAYYGYYVNSNTIGYQLRTNSSSRPAADTGYRYRIWFSSAGGDKWVPATLSNDTGATAVRTPNTRPIDPFGDIIYNSTNGTVSAGSSLAAGTQWRQYTLSVGYSFTDLLPMSFPAPVYVKCTPQADGSAIIAGTTQELPNTEDGYIYIYLGQAYSATAMELVEHHPIYYYNNSAIRQWTGVQSVIIDGGSATVNI